MDVPHKILRAARRLKNGGKVYSTTVRDFLSLFGAERRGAVKVEEIRTLVRGRDRKITGIVTASDLSMQFHALTEPFLLLREIELQVRRLLQRRLNTSDLSCLATAAPPTQAPKQIADLTFGQYVRLVQNPDISAKLNLGIDSSVLSKLLDNVRTIRNEVMHFDPDAGPTWDLETRG